MDLLGKSIIQLRELLDKKEVSGKELREYFMKRIKKYNPDLNAYLTIVDENKNENSGVLKDIPIAVKDNFCTYGVRTTASSKVLDDFIPPYESTVTSKLKEQGADVIGKTNMDAWAHGSSTEISDYGPTKNPWDITRVPGGSSGGSGAAVSSYLSPAAMGSDTGGSIRGPASWCGVVGLKPTYGRISRYGLIAMGSSFDCPGPMTMNVEDCGLLLKLLSGKDEFDATTSPQKVEDYPVTMKESRKLIIGVADEYFEGLTDDVKQSIESSLKLFEKMGHTIKKIKLLSPKYAISIYTILQRAEVSSNLSRFDGVRYGNDRSYFGDEAKRRIMLGTYTLSYGYYDAFYKKAQKIRTLVIENFKNTFKEVDVIVGPTMPVTALKLGEFKKYPFFGEIMDVLNEPASVAGIPALSIPVGLDSNTLPIGLQIIGNYFDEGTVLNLAYQFEKETEFFGVLKKGLKNYPDG